MKASFQNVFNLGNAAQAWASRFLALAIDSYNALVVNLCMLQLTFLALGTIPLHKPLFDT